MPTRNRNRGTNYQGDRARRSSAKPMSRRRTALRVEGLENRCLLSTTPELIGDLNVNHVLPGPTSAAATGQPIPFSSPFVKSGQLMVVNDTLFFSAVDRSGNLGLWATPSNGYSTEVAIFANAGSDLGNMTELNSELLFTVGPELWKSDGTAAGTAMVRDIIANGDALVFDTATTASGKLFFTLDDGVDGDQLWVSDGTPNGTKAVDPIAPGDDGSNASIIGAAGSLAYFTASDGSQGTDLWRSDGTIAGTVRLVGLDSPSGPYAYFPTGQTGGIGGSTPGSGASNVNGTLYFVNGNQLWISDGTTDGTIKLMDFSHEPVVYSTSEPVHDLTSFNGKLFFVGDDGVHGQQLWTSNGTTAGTVMISDFTSVPYRYPTIFTTFSGSLYFTVPDSSAIGAI